MEPEQIDAIELLKEEMNSDEVFFSRYLIKSTLFIGLKL